MSSTTPLGIRILRNPFVSFVVFRIFVPVFHWFVANLEAAYWTIKLPRQIRRIAKDEVSNLKGIATFGLEDWYRVRRFSWRSDPLRGMLDFSSKPWVSVFKNYGDCDDMARIAFESLVDEYFATELIFLYGEKGGHAIVVAECEGGGDYYLMNNQYSGGPFAHKRNAIAAGNGGFDPYFSIVYKRRVNV